MKRLRARASAWFVFFVVVPILTILVPGLLLISWSGGTGLVHAQENAPAGGDVIPDPAGFDPYL